LSECAAKTWKTSQTARHDAVLIGIIAAEFYYDVSDLFQCLRDVWLPFTELLDDTTEIPYGLFNIALTGWRTVFLTILFVQS
jgi:hypothetical protein